MAYQGMIFGLDETHYQDMAKIFSSTRSIEKVLIFGSRAKGTEKPGSDFDLAIFAGQLTDAEFTDLWSRLDQLPLVFKLDVVHWDRLNNLTLKEKILAEGKIFYPLTPTQNS